MKHVMVFGTFDLLHEGHHFLINDARSRGRVTIVVAQGKNVERIKGRPPQETDDERIAALRAAFPDTTVVLGDPTDFLKPLRDLKPDLLLFGYDQKLPPRVQEVDLPCPMERAESHCPEVFKSSLMKKKVETPD